MYKKAVITILTVILLLLCTGCNAIKKAVSASPDLNKQFSCNVKITLDNATEIVGTMTRYGTGIWEMEISEPDTLAGLKLSYNESGVSVSLGDLKMDIPSEKINDSAVFELIFNAVDTCAALPDIPLTETEEGMQYTGEISQCSYIFTFDKDTLQLNGISFPELNMSAVISDMCDLTEDETAEETTEQTEAAE